jgi:hypothetical protein
MSECMGSVTLSNTRSFLKDQQFYKGATLLEKKETFVKDMLHEITFNILNHRRD